MSAPQFEKRLCRPRNHLNAAGALYPGAWKAVDEFRASRGKELPNWPDWCYLPLAAAYAVVSGGGANRVPPHLVGDVGRLGAFMAWRLTQGIYRFDPAVYAEIVKTPVEGDVPRDVLFRLPEWCVYIETPGMRFADDALHGFFAHLEYDIGSGRPELRLLIDADAALLPVPVHLGPWSLSESIARMVDTASIQGIAAGLGAAPPGVVSEIRRCVEPFISLLLYLCSQNAEIGDGKRRPANPEPKRTKRGWRMFAADRPTTWDVGVRLGAALRSAYQQAESSGDGTHAGPRPHIRRAHWHGFRSGPMKRPDGTDIPAVDRQFDLRWLPPISVNLDTTNDLPATIRPVK